MLGIVRASEAGALAPLELPLLVASVSVSEAGRGRGGLLVAKPGGSAARGANSHCSMQGALQWGARAGRGADGLQRAAALLRVSSAAASCPCWPCCALRLWPSLSGPTCWPALRTPELLLCCSAAGSSSGRRSWSAAWGAELPAGSSSLLRFLGSRVSSRAVQLPASSCSVSCASASAAGSQLHLLCDAAEEAAAERRVALWAEEQEQEQGSGLSVQQSC